MKRKHIIIGITAAAAAALGVYFLLQSNNKSTMELSTHAVSLGKIESVVTATGTIQPITTVQVGTQVSGIVEKIYVDYNSIVQKGDTIAELDKSTLKTALNVSRANYQTAQNNLNYNKKTYERQKALFEKQMISQADFDAAEHAYKTTLNSLTQSKSDLEKAETNLSYATIISPINGVVLSRAVDVGQTVAASLNTPTLFTIAQDLSQIQVEANVDEADIGKIVLGQKVNFTVDAYPNATFEGEVKQIRLNPIVTSNVVTYTIIINSENEKQQLMPGMTATVTIYTRQILNTLVVPIGALNFTPTAEVLNKYYKQHKLGEVPVELSEKLLVAGEKGETQARSSSKSSSDENKARTRTIWIALADKSVQTKAVSIGARDGINVQILEGLQEGEIIISDIREMTLKQKNTAAQSPFAPSGGGRRMR